MVAARAERSAERLLQTFSITPETSERCQRLGEEFLAEFLRIDLDHRPDNLETLAELAHVLTRLGRLQEGLEVDRRLALLAPDNPVVHYNLACSLALVGDHDTAIDALERAVTLGYDDPEHLVADDDLGPLRGDPRFRALIRRLGGTAAGREA